MNKLNVLILEDEPLISYHIAQVIKKLECNLLDISTNFEDVMKIASKNRIDLLISDIKIIGVLDGIDVSKRVYELYSSEILFLTAHVDNETIKKASSVNSIGYLIKPFKEVELVSIIKMAIERHKQNRNILLNNNYVYNKHTKQIYLNKKPIDLTKNEQKMFNLLINNINNIIPYNYIDEVIWYNKIVSDSNRRQLIFRLKNKLINLNIEVINNIGLCLKI